jgi:hypothetical protein
MPKFRVNKAPSEDGDSESFWGNILESRLQMCSPQCSEGCNGDTEENEANDDWYPIRMYYDDEVPVQCSPQGPPLASLPKETPPPHAKQMDLQQLHSLPWADLDGKQKDCIIAGKPTARQGDVQSRKNMLQNANSAQSLLNFSSRTTGSAFRELPKPRFVAGIPSKAYQYKPDPNDPIDTALKAALRALSGEAAMVLALLRVSPGRYEIDGRQVEIYRDTVIDGRRFLVHEHEVGGPSMADMPLDAYVSLVANVALDLQKPNVAGLTFFEPSPATLKTSDGEDRYRAMRIACTQAKIREAENTGGMQQPAFSSLRGLALQEAEPPEKCH